VGGVLGTPKYMSPEQCQDAANLDIRSDIYSFGCMFMEMLTGKPPFVAKNMKEMLFKHINELPPTASSRVYGLTPQVDKIVLRCLSKKPDDRYPDFSVLQDELAKIYLATTGRRPPVYHAQPAEDSSTLGDKLNKSLSLFELGQKKKGAELFAEAIGKQLAPQKRQAEPDAPGKRRLVKGGLTTKGPRFVKPSSRPVGADAKSPTMVKTHMKTHMKTQASGSSDDIRSRKKSIHTKDLPSRMVASTERGATNRAPDITDEKTRQSIPRPSGTAGMKRTVKKAKPDPNSKR